MPKTGAHLKIEQMADKVMGVRLSGDPKKPEPLHFRVCFPGGDIDIVRLDKKQDGYWIHLRVDHPRHSNFAPGDSPFPFARVADMRFDIHGVHSSEVRTGDANSPDLYHVAVRIVPAAEEF